MRKVTDNTVFTQYESAARGYCRRFNPVFTSASGGLIQDAEGKEYIDFLAACGALNYGHNDPDMSAALIEHISRNGMSACLDLHSDVKAGFLDSLQHIILEPRGLKYRIQFTGPTGTNAVEAAMKLARKVTGRTNIISFTNGFHGVSLGSLAATGNKYHRMGGVMLSGVTRVPYENYLGTGIDTAEYLDKILTDPSGGVEAPAAILLETVQGEGGLNTASAPWLQRIAAIAKKHGALLIVDDIQAGCGRTGTFFSFEQMGIKPDIVTLSKSISGYGLPMALVLIKPKYDLWEPAEHNGTFRGNSHAFVTARVMLEKFWKDDTFSQSIALKSSQVTKRLTRIRYLIAGSYLKGRGMMQGISVGTGELADRICRESFKRGMICETAGSYDEVIKIFAPLTASVDLLNRGLDILEKATKVVMAENRCASRAKEDGPAHKDKPVATQSPADTSKKNARQSQSPPTEYDSDAFKISKEYPDNFYGY